jgi:hypothetical protein
LTERPDVVLGAGPFDPQRAAAIVERIRRRDRHAYPQLADDDEDQGRWVVFDGPPEALANGFGYVSCHVDEPFAVEVTDFEPAEHTRELSRSELWKELKAGAAEKRVVYRVGEREPLPEGILERLFDPAEHDTRRAAKDELDAHAALGLRTEDGLAVLRAAAERAVPDPDMIEPSETATWALVDSPREEYVALAREVYPALTGKHARVGLLRMLATLGTRDSEEALRDIVLAHAGDESFPGLWFAWAGARPNHPDVFIPRLFELLPDERHRSDVLDLCLTIWADDPDPLGGLEEYAEVIVATARDMRQALAKKQKPRLGPWRWAESYQQQRSAGGMVLDLLGRCPGEAAADELRAALDLTDPWLLAWAVAGLARHGEEIPAEPLERAAADPESRTVLFDALRDANRLDEMPPEHRTQAALAEADMVRWCAFPTELERPPEAIELMEVLPVDGDREVYVFRFRGGSGEDRKKWVAGVAGPFPKDADPPEPHGEATFSDFTPWEDRTAREHAEAIASALPPR